MKKLIVIAVLFCFALPVWSADPADLQKRLDKLLREKKESNIELTSAQGGLDMAKAKDAKIGLALEDLQAEIQAAGYALQQKDGQIVVVKPNPQSPVTPPPPPAKK